MCMPVGVGIDMKMLSLALRVGALAVVCLLGSSAVLPDTQGHRSSLRAKATMADGTERTITLEGVGCTSSMCSRVAVSVKTDSVWLDGLASVRDISADTNGSVNAKFNFKDGSKRSASIGTGNRILYVNGHFGRFEQLDLGMLTKLEFLQ